MIAPPEGVTIAEMIADVETLERLADRYDTPVRTYSWRQVAVDVKMALAAAIDERIKAGDATVDLTGAPGAVREPFVIGYVWPGVLADYLHGGITDVPLQRDNPRLIPVSVPHEGWMAAHVADPARG